jgi:hypothetical protein
MKMVKGLLDNKYALYAVIAMSAMQVMGYFTVNDPECLVLFVLVAMASRAFSKNMLINLGSAIVASNVLFAGKCVKKVAEGFATQVENSEMVPDSNPADYRCKTGYQEETAEDGTISCVPVSTSTSAEGKGN